MEVIFTCSESIMTLLLFKIKSRIKLSKKWGVKNPLLVLPPYDVKTHRKQKISISEKKEI